MGMAMIGRNEEIDDHQDNSVQRKEWEHSLRGLQRQNLRCNGVLSAGRRRKHRRHMAGKDLTKQMETAPNSEDSGSRTKIARVLV